MSDMEWKDKSEKIATLASALVEFQKALPVLTRDAKNPYHKSTYATLAHVLETVRPILYLHGLAVTQAYDAANDRNILVTTLYHQSGEWIRGRVALPSAGQITSKDDGSTRDKKGIAAAQDIGAQTTYLRRFGIVSILGLESEDDDGEGAMGRKPNQQPSTPPPQMPAVPREPDQGYRDPAEVNYEPPGEPQPTSPREPQVDDDTIKAVIEHMNSIPNEKFWPYGISPKQAGRFYAIAAKEFNLSKNAQVKSFLFHNSEAEDWKNGQMPEMSDISTKLLHYKGYNRLCDILQGKAPVKTIRDEDVPF